MESYHQAALFSQMARPDFYPHPADDIEQRETHISKVFLAGCFVYKIKKPVNPGFLDFTTLENRKYYCMQELLLNRRLTHNIYLDVVAITFNDGKYCLDGPGRPVEYAVKMHRLPDTSSMIHLLRNSRINEEELGILAKKLAGFYGNAISDSRINDFGTWETIRTNCEENFRQTEQFAQKIFDERLFKIVRFAMSSFLHRNKQLFDNRIKAKKIRDCHGDLRTEHIYYTDDGIQIIDCIEFNDRFRFQDVASDLAFLAMDLDYEGYDRTSEILLNAYVRYSKDFNVFVLIDFYKCYRAMVRFKVNCIRLQANDLSEQNRHRLLAGIEKYLNLAYQYAIRFTRPTLWVVCGMPASGKSTVSEELAGIFGIRVFNSDVIRKQMMGAASHDHSNTPFETGIYSKGITALTYGRLLLLAQEEIEKGESVILDATFNTAHHRNEAKLLAKDMDVNVMFVECVVPENLLKKRLLLRNNKPSISDARISNYASFQKQFEPLAEVSNEQHIIIYTQNSLDECMQRILNPDFSQAGAGQELRYSST
ncbi:MAG: AAA family ATPase [Desulfobacteraceae bacterium]|jgi:aminoglycoside phosphotransferase family enzyme/predicted kinase|nr:AAA family ATPase [Desulfobacteraceae bacterium]